MDFMHIKQGYTCIIYMKEICIPIHTKNFEKSASYESFLKPLRVTWCFSVVHANFVRTLVLYV